ncbi:MAG: MFS transporter [Phycisphaerae bacterium]|nr:MFS transporter [Phycisphaerae bacterium]
MSAVTRSQPLLPDWLVRNRNFVLLWAAYGISAFGDHLSEMALLKEAGGLERDDVTRVQALMTFCFFAPFVIVGPFAGWWADRFSRKWTMIGADLVRAAVVFSIPFIFVLPRVAGLLDDPSYRDFLVALPLALTGTFAALFSPCRQAMVPTLIRDDQLVRANAMISALGTIGAILSAVVGGLLVDWAVAGHFGLQWNYWLDAVTFVASAVLLLGIAMSRSRAVPHEIPTGVWTPIRQGFRYVWQHRRVLQVILLGTVFWAAAGVVISVIPAIVSEVFGGKYSDAGMYRGLIAAGLALGAALLTLIGRALPVPLAILASVLGGACWIFALDAALIFKLGRLFTGLCLLMIGVHGAGILVTVMVIIQHFVPDARRGRVFGVADMCTMAAIVATTGLLGLPHIEHLDRYIPYLLGVTGAGLLLTTLLAWREYRRGDPFPAILWLVWRLVRFYSGFWCRVRRVGPCTVPRVGPVIVAANHTAGIDPIVMLSTCTHRLISFVVEEKYYRVPLASWFMRQDKCIPVNRENPTKSFLGNSLRHLKEGGCMGIFPQGTYVGPDEDEPDARPGVGILALRTGATVIPCHISGTRYDDNPFLAFIRRHNVRVRYGKPVDLSAFRGREREKDSPQLAGDLIMREIRALAPEAESDEK